MCVWGVVVMKMGLMTAADIYYLLCTRPCTDHLHKSSHLVFITAHSLHCAGEQIWVLWRIIDLTQTGDWWNLCLNHSSILAWRIPWTEKPGGLLYIGSQRVRRDRSDLAQHTHSTVWWELCNRYSLLTSSKYSCSLLANWELAWRISLIN